MELLHKLQTPSNRMILYGAVFFNVVLLGVDYFKILCLFKISEPPFQFLK